MILHVISVLFHESPQSRQGNVIITLSLILVSLCYYNIKLRKRNARCTGNVPNAMQSESLLCNLMICGPFYLGDGYWVHSQYRFQPYQLFHSFVEWRQSL